MRARLFVLFLVLSSQIYSQAPGRFFIRFTDKNGSAFSVSNPSAFLSARALERRTKYHIAVTEQDLPVVAAYVDSVVSKGAAVFSRSRWFNGITVECDSNVLNAVLSLPFVQSGIKVFRQSAPRVHKDFSSGVPWNAQSLLKITDASTGYGGSFNQLHQLNGDFLHDNGYKGAGMQIAVLDDGFYAVDQLAAFGKLREENRILGTWDFVSNESSVFEDDSHGMSVLSTITGYLPGQLIGTAPEASFYLLRSEDAATENIIEEYNWNAAAEYADSAGADMISSSLGYTEFDDSTANHVYADMDGNHCPSSIAADIAASKGMLVITSAGNSGSSAWHYIGAPSDGDSVISVGAVDSAGVKAAFSSFGPASDGDIKPNVMAQGYKSTFANIFGGISTGNGTSFACPILAGVAACLWQKFPASSAAEIKRAIEKSANRYRSPDSSYGYGIPDFRIASYLLSEDISEFPARDEVLGVYPNPFNEVIHLRFYSADTQTLKIELYNELGQLFTSEEKRVSGGYLNTLDVDLAPATSKGVYFLCVKARGGNTVKVIVKQ